MVLTVSLSFSHLEGVEILQFLQQQQIYINYTIWGAWPLTVTVICSPHNYTFSKLPTLWKFEQLPVQTFSENTIPHFPNYLLFKHLQTLAVNAIPHFADLIVSHFSNCLLSKNNSYWPFRLPSTGYWPFRPVSFCPCWWPFSPWSRCGAPPCFCRGGWRSPSRLRPALLPAPRPASSLSPAPHRMPSCICQSPPAVSVDCRHFADIPPAILSIKRKHR